MVTNFESITHELTVDEIGMIKPLCKSLMRYKKENPITAKEIIQKWNNSGLSLPKISEPRLRKLVNYIRTNKLLPIIADSNGYYVASSNEEIQENVRGLIERANGILAAAKGLSEIII